VHLINAARIVVVCCKLRKPIVEERVRLECADIDHGAREPVSSGPTILVVSAPDFDSQDDVHREPEVARLDTSSKGMDPGETVWLTFAC
jgi:hypothetical protein